MAAEERAMGARTGLGLLAAGIAAMTIAHAAQAAGGAEAEITRLEAEWAQAIARHDFAALDRFVAADWRGQNEHGAEDRAQMLARAKAESRDVATAQNRDVHIRVIGDLAIAQGFEDDRGVRKGKPFLETVAWTDVWQKRPAGWIAIASQFTDIPPGK